MIFWLGILFTLGHAVIIQQNDSAHLETRALISQHATQAKVSTKRTFLQKPEPDSSSTQPSTSTHLPGGHRLVGLIILSTSMLSVFCLFPLLFAERGRYVSQNHDEKTYEEYLRHRFVHWYQSRPYSSAALLCILTMALIDCGVLLYWLLVGVNPLVSMYKIFSWSSRTNIQDEPSVGGRTVAVFVSIGGMIIFGLLLGIVQESFKSLFLAIETGRTTVVEGDHIIIVGHTECTNDLLLELIEAYEPTGGTVIAMLDERPRQEVLQKVAEAGINAKNSTLIVRSGRGDIHDLSMLAAETAKVTVLIADTTIPWEDADSKTIATIMVMKTQGWPKNDSSFIVAQCRVKSNMTLMENLYPGKVEVVVVNDIIAGLMVSSKYEESVCELVRMLISFKGSDFNMKTWPQLEGKQFGDILFQFPDAVPIGVNSEASGFRLCPPLSYTLEGNDEVIVLAEDPTSYQPAADLYFKDELKPIADGYGTSRMDGGATSRGTTKYILITGWNRMVGPLLTQLAPILAKGGEIDIYSPRPVDYRKAQVASIQKRRDLSLEHVTINYLQVSAEDFISFHELTSLALEKYEQIYVLSDRELVGGPKISDDTTVALLVKMQNILVMRAKELGKKLPFEPVVEICEKRTAARLAPYGMVNTVSVQDLVALALAQVTVNRTVHGIIADLLTVDEDGCDLHVCKLREFYEGPCPEEVSFADVVAASRRFGGQVVVVGWSRVPDADLESRRASVHGSWMPRVGSLNVDHRASSRGSLSSFLHPDERWDINPADKLTKRLWRQQDRVVTFIRHTSAPAASKGSQFLRIMQNTSLENSLTSWKESVIGK